MHFFKIKLLHFDLYFTEVCSRTSSQQRYGSIGFGYGFVSKCGKLLPKPTRTTRTPAFWGYPPPPHDYPHYWIPSQKNNRSRTENVTEQTRFSKSRSNDLEDIGQGQRSSHATHLLMLVIICTKYGKNPSRTVDATERTRFSRSTPNDLEDIGQGQRSSHATHLLMLVIICTKYGKNPSRTVDATERTRFSRSRPNDLEDIG